MIYLQLFYSFFKIGLFGFGGGYAMLSLIQSEVVQTQGWVSEGEFADIVAISQMTPGPISINSATYIGYIASESWIGSALATLGLCAPSLILMLTASYFFVKLKDSLYIKTIMRAMRPVVIGLILAAAFMLYNDENFMDIFSYAIFALSILLVSAKVNPVFVIAISGILGYIIY